MLLFLPLCISPNKLFLNRITQSQRIVNIPFLMFFREKPSNPLISTTEKLQKLQKSFAKNTLFNHILYAWHRKTKRWNSFDTMRNSWEHLFKFVHLPFFCLFSMSIVYEGKRKSPTAVRLSRRFGLIIYFWLKLYKQEFLYW